MKKNTLIFILFVITTFSSCENDVGLSSRPLSLIENAKVHFAMQNSEDKQKNVSKTFVKSPVWELATEFKYSGKDLVEVPILMNGKEYVYSIGTSKLENYNGITKLIFSKNDKNETQMRTLQLVCSESYFIANRDNYKTLSLTNLKSRNFSGYLIYSDGNDKMTAAYSFENGKIIAVSEKEYISKTRKTKIVCEDYWRCQEVLICWAYASCIQEEADYGGSGCQGVNIRTDCMLWPLGCMIFTLCWDDLLPDDE